MKPDRPDLEKIRELLEKATPGPWQSGQFQGSFPEGDPRRVLSPSLDGSAWGGIAGPDRMVCNAYPEADDGYGGFLTPDDNQLTVALRNAADWLLRAVEDARPIMVDGAAEWDWRRCKDWLAEFGGEETA